MEGDEPAEAIALANQRLKRAAVPGSIVLITDAIDASQLVALDKIREQGWKRGTYPCHGSRVGSHPPTRQPACTSIGFGLSTASCARHGWKRYCCNSR